LPLVSMVAVLAAIRDSLEERSSVFAPAHWGVPPFIMMMEVVLKEPVTNDSVPTERVFVLSDVCKMRRIRYAGFLVARVTVG
jgi:hypothetical protein